MPSIDEVNHLQIPLQDILSATNDFSKENLITSDGIGKVYEGESKKLGTIAVKRLDCHRDESGQADHEFTKEIRMLSRYKHENILSLVGFCNEDGEKILVYDYISEKSLDKYLESIYLSWTQRLQIALDVARGLFYLHSYVPHQHRIVHRDIKSANILLDDNWNAKVSDFGLSRNGPAPSRSVISNACGTFGYVDPEYVSTGRLQRSSDIYAFGVVLFEILTGRRAYDRINGQFFSTWVEENYKEQRLNKIIHSDLHEQINPASLLSFAKIAHDCLGETEKRPTLEKVVEQLQKALDNQLAASGPSSDVYSAFTDADYDNYGAFQHSQYAAFSHDCSGTTKSSSKSFPSSWKYDVFLSFRGQDTRETFVKCLYLALVEQRVYKDELITRGQSIGPSLFKAIQESKIAIVVFSKNYADSDWCLNELGYIMKCRAERGLVVIPIFYHVDPSDVRRQKRRYGEAFCKHELENIHKVESWRKALVDAANIAGFVVTGDEEKAIKEIVYTITHTYLCLTPSDKATDETNEHTNLIGIESRMQDLRSLLESGSGGVRMVGICGIWGGGKSALASSIYDEINNDFEGSCFIPNVSAESRMNGLKALQEKILSNIFRSKVNFTDTKTGVSMMATRLCRNRVLIVLDNVDHIDHLKMLIGSQKWFGDGSQILFTTRNQDLVNAHNCITHNVRMLDAEEAIELFSWHAFGSVRPIEGYEKLSQSLVSKCGGHPSALKSLGSFLHDKDMTEWKSTLARIEGIPIDDVLEKFNNGDDGVSRNTCSWLAT